MDRFLSAAVSAVGRAARSRPVSSLSTVLRRRRDDRYGGEQGQGLAEYSLILGGIAVVAIVSLVFLGGTITELFWDPIDDQFADVLCNIVGICPPPP